MPEFASGTLTFLFTDIEGSTRLLDRVGPDVYGSALSDERRILRETCGAFGAMETSGEGDSFLFVFPKATDALAAAVDSQLALIAHAWPEGALINVRMGLHTGEAIGGPDGYVGIDIHRAHRISSAARGRQILCSLTTTQLVASTKTWSSSFRFLGEYRLKDLGRPEPIYQVVRPGLPSEFPPLRSLDALPNNLPLKLTKFIGRETEMAEVEQLIESGRLVTLTGSGGCGKSRLAVQVAADVAEDFPDGVRLVELAPITEEQEVIPALAAALQVNEQPGQSLIQSILEDLVRKKLLLVLDNCEHVRSECAVLTGRLLVTCPDLKILTTSRETLDVAGETAWRVPSLTLPDTEDEPYELLMTRESVRLLVDRASYINPKLQVGPQDARALARVSMSLEGIPLAIELAAARLNVLTLEQIAERVEDALKLLKTGDPTVPARQRTLEGLIAWSYNLLSPPEQRALEYLSVFRGGFTLDAAEVVLGNSQDPSALDLLDQLVRKSLVAMEERAGRARYRMLRTIRQYAEERLADRGEVILAEEAHFAWLSQLHLRAREELLGPEHRGSLVALEAERDNVRVAIHRALSRRVETVLSHVAFLASFFAGRGSMTDARDWLERALATTEADPADRASALHQLGIIARAQGDLDGARSYQSEYMDISRKIGNRAGEAAALSAVGLLDFDRGDLVSAEKLMEEGIELWRETGDLANLARALSNRAILATAEGDSGAARKLSEESLQISRKLGAREGVAAALLNLASLHLDENDLTRAESLTEETLKLHRDLGDAGALASSLTRMASVKTASGELTEALGYIQEAMTLLKEEGNRLVVTTALEAFGKLEFQLDAADRAARLYGAAQALRERLSLPLRLNQIQAHEKIVAELRASLGMAKFEAAWAEGRAMNSEAAIAFALEDS